MRTRLAVDAPPPPPLRSRCRCGHLPTHHMAVAPIGTSGNYRLEPTAPCAICGEGICRKYSPGES